MKVEVKGFLSCEALEEFKKKAPTLLRETLLDNDIASDTKSDVFRHELIVTFEINEEEPNDGSGETTSN